MSSYVIFLSVLLLLQILHWPICSARSVQTAKLVVLLDDHAEQGQIGNAVRSAIAEARRRNYFSNTPAASPPYMNSGRSGRPNIRSRNDDPLFDLVQATIERVGDLSAINLTELVCKEVAAGAVAFIGPADVDQRRLVRTLCDRVGIIYIEIYCSSYAQPDDLSLRSQTVMDVTPPRNLYAAAVADYIAAAGWTEMHFVFDNHAALMQLEPIMSDPRVKFTFYQAFQPFDTIKTFGSQKYYERDAKYDDVDSHLLAVRQLWRQHRRDGSLAVNDAILVAVRNVSNFVNAVLQHQMITPDYTYLVVDLDSYLYIDSDLTQMSRIGANISVIKLAQTDIALSDAVQKSKMLTQKVSTQAALAYDATILLIKGLAQLVRTGNGYEPFHPFSVGQVSCGSNAGRDFDGNDNSNAWSHGDTLLNLLEAAALDEIGSTGPLSLHRSGAQSSELTRRLVEFQLLRMNRAGRARLVQQWKPSLSLTSRSSSKSAGWQPVKKQPTSTDPNDDDDAVPTTPTPVQEVIIKKVLTIATRLVVPFVMKAPPEKIDKNIRPRDKSSIVYQGYAIDLINSLAEWENFQYKFVIAPGNTPGVPLDGSVDDTNTTAWSGMIGMLLRGEADMAVADLSVTARRSAVVSFTEPFMTQGIGVLFQSPRPTAPHLFGLLKAYSPAAWICIVIALIVTSQLLRILGRLSPYEWTNAHECTGAVGTECENNFNYRNSLWFCAITFMLQGCDINPRAPSTRLLAASWWIFALVLWISYVANLAAFLTVDTMSTPIRSVDDLVKQTTIKYGTIRNASQEEFFRASKIPTFRQMWNIMSSTPSIFTTSDEEGRARVAAGGYAYLTDTSRIRYWVNRNCSLAQVGSPINVDYYSIALPKGSQLVETLSRGILAMKTKDLPQFEDKWWKASGAKCNEQGGSDSSSGGPQPLTAKVVGGIYVMGLGGLLVAFIVAIIEFVWQARKNVQEHGAGATSVWREMLRELLYAFLVHRPPKRAPRHVALEAASATHAIAASNVIS